MKRLVLMFAIAVAFCASAAIPSFAQPSPVGAPAAAPLPLPESPQTVRAAIPVQARPATAPTPARPVEPSAQERPFSRSPSEADPVNIRLDVVITYQAGNAPAVKRSATLTVADQGRGSLRSGTQVAVPDAQLTQTAAVTRSDGGPPVPAAPVTRFQYRSVGLNVDANRVGIVGNKARLELSVEFSAIDDKPSDPSRLGASPSFPTFSQNLTLILENGKPLVIAQTSDVVDSIVRKQSVEVTATILR